MPVLREHNSYMTAVFDGGFENLLADAREALEGVDFDTMVGRGLSGALVIPRLAEAMGKHWMIVRKPGENSHSSRTAEGRLGERWLFVDDFIATGETYRIVRHAIESLAIKRKHRTEHVGVYKYELNSFKPPKTSNDLTI